MYDVAEQVVQVLTGPRPLPIVAAGDPVLRRSAAPFDGQLDAHTLAELIAAMREAMLAAPGVGLAAPQVGIGLRIAVIEDTAAVPEVIAQARDRRPQEFLALINPSYRPVGEARSAAYEGCLSVPGYQAVVNRFSAVELSALDVSGRALTPEFTGWAARIVQHEVDHLDGTLYLDRAQLRSLADTASYQTRWGGPSLEPARRALGF